MKLTKASSGKTRIILTKKEWENIGRTAQWYGEEGAEDLVEMDKPVKQDMMEYLGSIYGSEEEWRNEAEVAIYYFARDYHSGQWSELYSILSTSPYSPGPYSSLESEGDLAQMMYESLEDQSERFS